MHLTIRNVPEGVIAALEARAAREELSLQEYLLRHLEALAARPTIEEWTASVRADKALTPVTLSAEQILGALDADRR